MLGVDLRPGETDRPQSLLILAISLFPLGQPLFPAITCQTVVLPLRRSTSTAGSFPTCNSCSDMVMHDLSLPYSNMALKDTQSKGTHLPALKRLILVSVVGQLNDRHQTHDTHLQGVVCRTILLPFFPATL